MTILNFWFLFLSITEPAVSFAGTFCDDANHLSEIVNYCHENFAYVEPAQRCRDHFKAEAKAKNAEIEKLIAQDLAKANDKAQSGTFEANAAVLTSADTTLASLIDQGEGIYAEVEDYGYGMVMPLYLPEDFQLNFDDPQVQAGLREDTCYGQPQDELDDVKKDIEATLTSLQKAKTNVDKLLALSKAKDEGLDSKGKQVRDAKGAGAGKALLTPVGGKAPKDGSDITGTQQNKEKEQEAPKPAGN